MLVAHVVMRAKTWHMINVRWNNQNECMNEVMASHY
jgi:hypothetical protein